MLFGRRLAVQILRWFWKYDVNITRIESRPSKRAENVFDMYVDFDGSRGDDRVDQLIHSLDRRINSILVLDNKEVGGYNGTGSEYCGPTTSGCPLIAIDIFVWSRCPGFLATARSWTSLRTGSWTRGRT